MHARLLLWYLVLAWTVTTTCAIVVQESLGFVYKSGLLKDNYLNITGKNISTAEHFLFRPQIIENLDYSLSHVSEGVVRISLIPGRQWSSKTGEIRVIAVTDKAGVTHSQKMNVGVCIAVAIRDPVINTKFSNKIIHASQNSLQIRGQDLLTEDLPADDGGSYYPKYHRATKVSITLSPTLPRAYAISQVKENYFSLRLEPKGVWASTTSKSIPLKVTAIDTGAGNIVFDIPITVGKIVPDVIGYIPPPLDIECINSCPFARDGVCDDSRGTKLCVAGTDCQVT